LNANLANGNYAALAGQISQLNYATFPGSGNEGLPPVPPAVNGAVLSYNKFPENFILTNPQFGCSNNTSCTPVRDASDQWRNSNYHSLQVLQKRFGISPASISDVLYLE
jgi:hypothetical protein